MMKTKLDYRRTHNCGALSSKNIDETVTLSGWVNRRRDHGGLIFIDLRDRFGITQLVFDPEKNSAAHTLAETLRSEDVLTSIGSVSARSQGMANPKLKTGEIEILVNQVEVLSKSKTPPFSVCDEDISVNEELRLKYRYLDIRRGDVANKLVLRHKGMQAVRRHLSDQEFLEITTPIMGKSTPEGARDYLVPSRVHPTNFYALPQSPQIFKQLLMISGMDRYFQIAQCFRDEDLRADRQPEFTQIDMEMSFATTEELFPILEGVMQALFKEVLDKTIPGNFRKESYAWCLENYGTDKPDLRFDMPLIRLDDIAAESSFSIFQEVIKNKGVVKAIAVEGGAAISRREIDEYTTFVGQFGIKGLAWMKVGEDGKLTSSIVKFFSEELQVKLIERMGVKPGDLLFMIADVESKTNQGLDHLRRKVAKDRNMIDSNSYEFLWVTDFPLMEWNEEGQNWIHAHHPFTAPLEEDLHLLEKSPEKVRASSYDLVLNGYELVSGSQRIHNSDLQQKVFEALKLSEEELQARFGFFTEALRYGTPPHLGAAIGFDRIMMILTQTENIKDVIAFPKTQRASDLMMECPSPADSEQLKELSIKTVQ